MISENSPSWLQETRGKAAKEFLNLPVPTRRNELFKYTYVGNFDWDRISQSLASSDSFRSKGPSVISSTLKNCPDLRSIDATIAKDSKKEGFEDLGIDLVPFADNQDLSVMERFAEEFGSIAKNYDDDKFLNLAAGGYSAGFCLRVRANQKVELPLHLLHGDSWGSDPDLQYRVLIVLEKGAEATLIEEFASVESPLESLLRSGLVEIVLHDESHLNYVYLQNDLEQADHIRRTLVRLGKAANMTTTNVYVGGKKSQDRWEIELVGDGSNFKSKGSARVSKEQSVDFVADVRHRGSHTESGVDFWSVADEKGKVIFNGLVDVDAKSLHTDAFQKNRGLLLGTSATIHAMPKLIIGTDEVACAHGASISRLSDDQLFYIQSRGVEPSEAKRMVVDGFTEPALNFIASKDIKHLIHNLVVGAGVEAND